MSTKYKSIKFWFLRNKGEIITGIATVIIFVLTYIFTKEPKKLLLYSVILVFLSTFIAIYFRSMSKDFYYIPLTKQSNKNEWLGKGKFDFDKINNCFYIEGKSDSSDFDSTYIFKNCLTWSDYKYSFSFKIVNSCIGVVVRAIDLSNFIMLQIHKNGVNPHIKINRLWIPFNYEKVGLINEKEISLNKWYFCSISCIGNVIGIKINIDEQKILDNSWNIPDTIKLNKVTPVNNQFAIQTLIPVDLDYGSVGFRNSRTEENLINRDEKALVKDMLIEKV